MDIDFFQVLIYWTFLFLFLLQNIMMIISRDLRELSETSLKILDFFIKFYSETQKMLLF